MGVQLNRPAEKQNMQRPWHITEGAQSSRTEHLIALLYDGLLPRRLKAMIQRQTDEMNVRFILATVVTAIASAAHATVLV